MDADASSSPEALVVAVVPEGQALIREGAAAGEWLREHAPALFGRTPKPIKLHIQKDIEARFPGRITRAALTAFLRRHTGSTSYLIALTRAHHRFDLDGQPAGELSESHKAAAQQALTERRERLRQRDAEMEDARRWRADLLKDWGRTSLSRTNFCALKGIAESALDALLAQARQEHDQRPASTGPREGVRQERRQPPQRKQGRARNKPAPTGER